MARVKRILIADDESEIRYTLGKALGGTHACTAVESGEAAIDAIAEAAPDAVITDLKMPGKSGLDVLAAVKERDPLIPVVIMTGYATLDTAVEALRLGAYDYIQKPFEDLRVVQSTLGHALEASQLRRENLRVLDDLRHANAFKTQLLRTVAHDFKNMLQGIVGFSDLARMSEDIDEMRAEIDDIQTVAQGMQLLANDLTTYGQLDSRALTLYPQEISLLDCVRKAARMIHVDDRRHTLVLPEETAYAWADPHRVTQVLTNLLGNAVKYSPRGGPVEVRLAPNGGDVVVSVQDHGLGIPEEAMQRLFTAFFRVDRDARSEVPGTGLGLTIVKSLVESQGGRVWLESVEGEGTTFHFSLPSCVK